MPKQANGQRGWEVGVTAFLEGCGQDQMQVKGPPLQCAVVLPWACLMEQQLRVCAAAGRSRLGPFHGYYCTCRLQQGSVVPHWPED